VSEFKGTPSPWSVEHDEIVSESGLTICVIGCETSEERLEANLKLIATSPELFKAVNDFLNHFEGDIPLWLFEEAEAAVAKAIGK
jgi:hypothetical protein